MSLTTLVDASKTSLFLSLGSITFNPTAWNIIARNEYRNKTITRIFGGNAHLGCYFFAVCTFSAGRLRDRLYLNAILEQPHARLLPTPFDTLVPAALFVIGQTFIVMSTWSLGITGRFLGDYFGIIMDARVKTFPYNVLRNPIYAGSTMCFAATAFWYERPVGLLITLYVHIVYTIAQKFEGPFTDMIYSKRPTSSKKLDKEL
ncbi:phospholipid methyltransferase [Russula emetica]|nr:phospholipid methyltransferase [Russula emetica]